ncbi:type 3 dihydrofolate reductase [uncultured Tolumonas sp.]|uniref:type 3 dihydrofolate reductase n=1 Tax=uncultured Tolumonas sp. TaxID=263765 RepID=UPI002A0A1679|nr:type 3 dihydrofolate reductase [uncultured Tolumonas sp.]
MLISLIVAMAENRVIGRGNQMPWHLPADLRHFKSVTLGKPVIMGRKTFESIGRPLPGRRNVVISRSADWQAEGVESVNSLHAALALVQGATEVMIIGGGQLYSEALPLAQRLYLTHIELPVADADTWFPDYSQYQWQQRAEELHDPDEKNPYHYRFETLDRCI